MQDDIKKFLKKENEDFEDDFCNPFLKSAYMTNPYDTNEAIVKKQIEILSKAIEEYNRLEDVKKFTKMALVDIEEVTEEDIQRALELEEKISIEDDIAVQKLLQSEGLLNDLYNEDFKLD